MADKLHFDDLTQITCPFGLLDDDTQDRLKTWPHGWTFLSEHGDWCKSARPWWMKGCVYRAKPAP